MNLGRGRQTTLVVWFFGGVGGGNRGSSDGYVVDVRICWQLKEP